QESAAWLESARASCCGARKCPLLACHCATPPGCRLVFLRLSFGFLRRSCGLLRFAAIFCFGGLRLQQLQRLLERDRLWIDIARDRGEQALVTYIGAVAASAHRHRLTVPGMI